MKKLVLALVATFYAMGASATEQCTLKQLGSLDMTFLRDGTAVVPIKIGGRDRNMILEIGVANSAITQNLADELKLRPSVLPKGATIGYFGETINQEVMLSQVQIGVIAGDEIHVLLMPHYDSLEDSVVGVLGTDLLSNFDFEIDFKNRKLNLFSHDHCEGSVVYWADAAASVPFTQDKIESIQFQMQLDGEPVQVQFAMSPSHGVMSLSTAHRLFGIDLNSPDLQVIDRDSAGNPKRYRFPFKSLSFDGVAINNPVIDLVPDNPALTCDGKPHMANGRSVICYGEPDISIGLSELSSLHLFFAFKEKRLYVTAADAHK